MHEPRMHEPRASAARSEPSRGATEVEGAEGLAGSLGPLSLHNPF
jgi:hypothetical protein